MVKGLKVIDRSQEPAREGGSERKRGAAGVISSSSPPSSSSSLFSTSESSPLSTKGTEETSGSVVAAADAVSASRSLAAIAFTKRNFEVVVTRPFIDLFPTADGRTTRVARALKGGDDETDDDDDDDDDGNENGNDLLFEPEAASSSPSSTSSSGSEQHPNPSLGPAAGMRFSAEARGGLGGGGGRGRGGGAFSLVVAEGRARVPIDVREALGESVHAVALLGEEALLSDGADMLTYRGKSAGSDDIDGGEERDDDGNGGDQNDGDDDGILSGVPPSSPLSVPYDASWASRWRSSSKSCASSFIRRGSGNRDKGSAAAAAEEEEEAAAAAAGARDEALPLLPRRGGRAAVPAAFEVRSEKAAVAADGWLLLPSSSFFSSSSSPSKLRSAGGSGGGAKGPLLRRSRREKKQQATTTTMKAPVFVLRKPAAARAALTPPLVRHCLSRLSPLLADAVAVSGSGGGENGREDDSSSSLPALAATLSPANAVLFPRFSRGVLKVEPLRVELKKSKGGTGIASKALGWLEKAAAAASVVSAASGSGGSDASPRCRFPFGGGGGGSPASPLSSALSFSPSLVAWTSPADIDLKISKRGGVTVGVRRVDVLVGPPEKKSKRGTDDSSTSSSSTSSSSSSSGAAAFVVVPDAARSARFATWGTVDAEGRRIALTLGIPAETLKRAVGGGGAPPPPSPPPPPPSPPPPPPPPSSSSPSSSPPSPSGKLSHVPDDSMLCFDIRGSLDAPRVDFAGATARLAELVALSSAARASSSPTPPSSLLSSRHFGEDLGDYRSPSSSFSSSFVSPALAAVKKMFWRKAAERARGGGKAEPRSVPGSGGNSVPPKTCEVFPWETEAEGTTAKGRKRLGQIEAVLRRQQRQQRQQQKLGEAAVFDER